MSDAMMLAGFKFSQEKWIKGEFDFGWNYVKWGLILQTDCTVLIWFDH